MKFLNKILEVIKEIVFMPKNLSYITRRTKDLEHIEKKIDSISQKIHNIDFDSISGKLDSLQSQIKRNTCNLALGSREIELNSLVSIIEEKFNNQFLQLESLISIYNSLPNIKFIPATRGWAGSPDFLSKIVEIILKVKPRFVLEASSGVSSVIIGLTLKMNGFGKALSFDHDNFYANITRENIDLNEIGNISFVKHCPLKEYNENGQIWKWYNTDHLNLIEKIDMLIIDGPPGATQFLARYPAVPLLYKYFSDRVLILLDDAKRRDEVIIVEMWIDFLKKNNFEVKVQNFKEYEKGMLILDICRIK